MFQSSSSSSSLFLDPYNFRTIKKIKKRDAEKWNVLECEVVRKKTKKGNKEKKNKGTCVEEVVGKNMKEGNKEKKLRGLMWRRKKREKKEVKKKGNMDKK